MRALAGHFEGAMGSRRQPESDVRHVFSPSDSQMLYQTKAPGRSCCCPTDPSRLPSGQDLPEPSQGSSDPMGSEDPQYGLHMGLLPTCRANMTQSGLLQEVPLAAW